MTNFSVIITAGGTSSRYGNKNKLLEIIKDKTVIQETVDKFVLNNNISEIIMPVNLSVKDELCRIFKTYVTVIITDGGDTRQQSVYKALQYVKNDYVLIHDGARPLVSSDVIAEVMSKTLEKNAVSVMTKTTDTIKEVDESGQIIRTIDRTKLYNTQTPQGFKTSVIKDAHNRLKGQNFTDDCSMLEALGFPVFIVNGEYTNIKITTKSDLDFARVLYSNK